MILLLLALVTTFFVCFYVYRQHLRHNEIGRFVYRQVRHDEIRQRQPQRDPTRLILVPPYRRNRRNVQPIDQARYARRVEELRRPTPAQPNFRHYLAAELRAHVRVDERIEELQRQNEELQRRNDQLVLENEALTIDFAAFGLRQRQRQRQRTGREEEHKEE